MVIAQFQRDLQDIQRKTRVFIVVSTLAHVCFLVWLLWSRALAAETETFTEVTWLASLDPAPEAMAAVPEPAQPAPPAATPAAIEAVEENFEREPEVAEVSPDPQKLAITEDRLASRLASLQKEQPRKPLDVAAVQQSRPVSRSRLAGTTPDAPVARASKLERTTTTGAPIALQHASPIASHPALQSLPNSEPQDKAPDRASATATRMIAGGAQMTGPVADRPIVSFETPAYPDWAKREGVEGTVLIHFYVLPNGNVKENVMVERTSGFSEFDERAVKAILAWQFEPLRSGTTGEQWGTILFHYRLE